MEHLRLFIAIARCPKRVNPIFIVKPDDRVRYTIRGHQPTHEYAVINTAWQEIEELFTRLVLARRAHEATCVMEWLWRTLGIGMNHPDVMASISDEERDTLEAIIPEVPGYDLLTNKARMLAIWEVGTALSYVLVNAHNEYRLRPKARPPGVETVSLSLNSPAASS